MLCVVHITFFQIGTEAFKLSMQYSTAAIASLRWTDDIAMTTLASCTGTILLTKQPTVQNKLADHGQRRSAGAP